MAFVTPISRWSDAPPVQAVVNLAGQSLSSGRWTTARKQMIYQSRLQMTHGLRQWIAQLPPNSRPDCVVSGSAIGYYGDRGEALLYEQSPPAADFSARLCQDWESAAHQIAPLGPRVCTVRTGIVLGRNGGAFVPLRRLFQLGLGNRIGSGHQWMSWIHIDDETRLIEWLILNGGSGAYNATAANPMTHGDFIRQLGAAMHRMTLFSIPAWAVRMTLGELSTLVLASQRVIPQRAQEEGFQFQFPSLDKALHNLL